MRVLLDESVPKRLGSLLSPHQVVTVAQRGWRSLSNGELLSKAATEFDVLITADRGMEHQQNIPRFRIAVVVLVARRNRLKDYEPLVPKLVEALASMRSGEVLHIAL